MKNLWMPPSQERVKWSRTWALASETLGLCPAPATPRVCGFQQAPQTLCLGFPICRMGQWCYPAPRVMARMAGDRCSYIVRVLPLPHPVSSLWSSPWKSAFKKTLGWEIGLPLWVFLFFKIFLLIDWLLAMLGLRFCARAFSSCGKRGPLFIAVRGPLTVAASLVVEHRLQTRRLSNCGSRA